MNVYQILVTAIVAIAILAAVFQYIVPLFFSENDAVKVAGELLKEAEFSTGKVFYKEGLLFGKGSVISAESFDTQRREVVFRCNSPLICPKFLDVDAKKIVVKESINTGVGARCEYQYNLFTCRVYLGIKPAQLEVAEVKAKEKIDAASEDLEGEVKVKNTGSDTASDAVLELKLYAKFLQNNVWERSFLREKKIELGDIGMGEEVSRDFDMEVKTAGRYILSARAEGEEAGFDVEEIEFEATGYESFCETGSADAFGSYDSELLKCKKGYSCSNCEFAFECRNKWKEEMPEKEFEPDSAENAFEVYGADSEGNC